MIRRGGFTIVELIVTITIMAILMTVGVIGLRSTQIDARDSERKSDVDQIMLGLQSFYQQPRPEYGFYGQGSSYPNVREVMDETKLKAAIPDINTSALRAPGVARTQPISLIAATNSDETTSGVQPQPSVNQYVYQPMTDAWKGVGYSMPVCPSASVFGGSGNRGCHVCDGSFAYSSVITMQPDGSFGPSYTDNPSSKQVCYRYNLFYRLEGDNTVYKVMSKDQ